MKMKPIHFVQFANAMMNESINVLMDANMKEFHADEQLTIANVQDSLVAMQGNNVDLDELANEMGMYEFVEAYADDEEHPLNSIAVLYCE